MKNVNSSSDKEIMYACTDGWMDGWIDGWINGCLAACMHPCMDAGMDVYIYIYLMHLKSRATYEWVNGYFIFI